MRVGIIGAGVSGMTAAWLLQHDHQVTLMDKADRLGGHVETMPVVVAGQTVYAELGPRFFFDSAYPHFLALLRELKQPIRWSDGNVSFTDLARGRSAVLPPRSLRHVAKLLRSPSLLGHVLSLRRLIREQPAISARRDFTTTFRTHLERSGYPASFGPEFAFPFLAACWGAPLHRLPDFPVYSLLKGMPLGTRPGFYEVLGGMSHYIRAFARELLRVDVRLGVDVGRIQHEAGLVVLEVDGEQRRFDQLIVATSPRDASALLRGVPAADEMHRVVEQFRHFEIEIAVHGDRSLMPRDRRAGAHNNLFVDGDSTWMTDWQGLRDGLPVFRTWLPKGRAHPTPLYAHRSFHHVLMTPENALLQQRISALQGHAGLWLLGMYCLDVDNHESALLSALVPAKALAPRSPNLRRLLDGVARHEHHRLDTPLPLSRRAPDGGVVGPTTALHPPAARAEG